MNKEELAANESVLPDFNSTKAKAHRNMRNIKDVTTRYLMTFGGVSVIMAIVLIAFYLFYVVLPMFKPADVDNITSYEVPGNSQTGTYFFAMEEQHEVGLRVSRSGEAVFFTTGTGEIVIPRS